MRHLFLIILIKHLKGLGMLPDNRKDPYNKKDGNSDTNKRRRGKSRASFSRRLKKNIRLFKERLFSGINNKSQRISDSPFSSSSIKEKILSFINNHIKDCDKDSVMISAIMAVFFVCVVLALDETIGSDPMQSSEPKTMAAESGDGAETGSEHESQTDPKSQIASVADEYRPDYRFQRPRSLLKEAEESKEDDEEDEEFVPSADVLNMAYYYAEDADTSDAINSYAGQVYQELTGENAELYSSFYDLTDTTPLAMARQLGLGAKRVTGNYNPEDSSHNPLDPSSWIINSFKNVNVNFRDGDGNRISGHYIVNEIMSLASVYMYYHEDYDPEHFMDYCEQLFKAAITTKVSMGSVYYCDGCLSRTTQQELAEALKLEAESSMAPFLSDEPTPINLGVQDSSPQGDKSSVNDSNALSGGSGMPESTMEVIVDTALPVPTAPAASTAQTASAAHNETAMEVIVDTALPAPAATAEPTVANAPAMLPETAMEIINETAPLETAMAATNPAVPSETMEVIVYDESAEAGEPQVKGTMEYISEDETAVSSVISTIQNEIQDSPASLPDNYSEESLEEENTSYAVYNSSTLHTSKAYVDENGVVHYTDNKQPSVSEQPSVQSPNGQTIDGQPLPEDPSQENAANDGNAGNINNTGNSGNISNAVDSSGNSGNVSSTGGNAGNSDNAVGNAGDADDAARNELLEHYNTLLQQAKIQANAESYCPGHIDINVSITIRGIEDKKGLFAIDSIGNNKDNFTDKWQGWTDQTILEAKTLNARDWFDEYGISISSISLYNSVLTDEQIDEYMAAISESSESRQAIVKYALQSVGKIPYYWGGKPSGPGFENNNFSELISADYRGRILKGLDCSGWINWVYWSVTGNSLPGQSTETLIGCGKRIKRSELQPGDIIIRVGDDAHVVMFLCWAEDGDFYAVHETGGIINNVTVSKMTANWPYYRTLI